MTERLNRTHSLQNKVLTWCEGRSDARAAQPTTSALCARGCLCYVDWRYLIFLFLTGESRTPSAVGSEKPHTSGSAHPWPRGWALWPKWERFPPPDVPRGFRFFIIWWVISLIISGSWQKKLLLQRRIRGGGLLRRWGEVVGQAWFLGGGLGVCREAALEDGAQLPAGISGGFAESCCLTCGSQESGADMPIVGIFFTFLWGCLHGGLFWGVNQHLCCSHHTALTVHLGLSIAVVPISYPDPPWGQTF